MTGINVETVAKHYDTFYAPHASAYPKDAEIIFWQHNPADGPPVVRSVSVHDRQAFIDTVVSLGTAERIDLPIAPRSRDALIARAAAKGEPWKHKWMRGGPADCYPLPCLFLDIDVLSPRHKEKDLPTREQALDLIKAMPLPPTMVTESLGGFQVFIALDSLLDIEEDEDGISDQGDALARQMHWLNTEGKARGFAVDLSPIRRDGGLRVAGTVAGKGGPDHDWTQVIVEHNDSARYDYSDIMSRLDDAPDALVIKQSRTRVSNAVYTGAGGQWLPEVDEYDEEIRPGDRFAALLPISQLVTEVFGGEVDGSRVKWPHENGEVSTDDSHADLFNDDFNHEIEKVSIYGNRWLSAWNAQSKDVFSSFDYLARVHCDGDFTAAARIASFVMGEDEDQAEIRLDALLCYLRGEEPVEPVERLAAMLEDAAAPAIVPQPFTPTVIVGDGADDEETADDEAPALTVVNSDGETVDVSAEQPSAEMEVADMADAPIAIGSDGKIEVDLRPGANFGVWRMEPIMEEVETGNGQKYKKVKEDAYGKPLMKRGDRIADWVAFRTSERHDGDEKQYDVKLLRAEDADRDPNTGRVVFRQEFTATGMSAADSSDIKKVWTEMGAGVLLPESRNDCAALSNVIDALGHSARTKVYVNRRTGVWKSPDGTHRFLGVLSSRSAKGTVYDYLATMPKGLDRKMDDDDAVSDRPVQENIGWVEDKVDLREAAGAIEGFRRIAPNLPGYGVAVLGLLFAAPLRCPVRTTVVLLGLKDSNKSLAASAITPFFSVCQRSSGDPMVNIDSDTMASIRNWMRWTNDLPLWEDDLRTNVENRRANEAAQDRGKTLIQGAYNGAIGSQATGDGGQRKNNTVRSPGLMTAETISSQGAIVSRMLALDINKGDIETKRQPDGLGGMRLAGIDAFDKEFGDTRLANALFGDYISWILEQLDERGEIAPMPHRSAIKALGDWANRRRKHHFDTFGAGGRNAEAVGYLRMGWEVAFMWAEARGIRDLLPTQEDIDSVLKGLLLLAEDATENVAPGLRFLRATADLVSGGQGHLTAADGGVPKTPHLMGYKNTGDQMNARWVAQGPKVGIISSDYQHVVLTASGLAAAKNMDGGLASFTRESIRREILGYTCQDLMSLDKSTNQFKASSTLGCGRPTGYVVTWEALFGSDEEGTPAAAPAVEVPAAPAPILSAPATPAVQPVAVQPAAAPVITTAPPKALSGDQKCTECGKGSTNEYGVWSCACGDF